MSRRRFAVNGFALAALVGLSMACAGKAPEKPAATSETPAASTPVNAANDASPTTGEAPRPYDPAEAAGAVKGIPAPTNTAPIEAVANYFVDLPGFDVKGLPQAQREKLLQRVNSEMCTCGCKNDTLAKCLVNDPKCPTVKGLVQTVYDEVKSGR